MCPGASIQVGSNNPAAAQIILDLRNCTLGGCSQMWRGIIVNNAAWINVVEGTTISDAAVAIDINGVIVHADISNAVFNQNYTGIWTRPGLSGLGNWMRIIDCTFNGDAPLKPAYSGQVAQGLYGTRGYAGLRHNSPTFYDGTGQSISAAHIENSAFTGFEYGINASQNLRVFDNCAFTGYTDPVSGEKGGFGISAFTAFVYAWNNAFTGLATGIWVSKGDFDIHQNNFNDTNTGISLWNRLNFGLPVQGSRHCTVDENTINNVRFGIVSQAHPASGPTLVIKNNDPVNAILQGIAISGNPAYHGNFEVVRNHICLIDFASMSHPLYETDRIGININGVSNGNLCQNSVSFCNLICTNTFNSGPDPCPFVANGIRFQSATSIQCRNNNIASTGTYDIAKTAIQYAGNTNAQVSCNYLDLTETGMRIEGPSAFTTLRANIFNFHFKRGLHYRNNAVTGIQYQPSNKWNYNTYTTNPGAINEDGAGLWQSSRFLIDNDPFGQEYFPYVIPGGNQWFNPANYNYVWQCPGIPVSSCNLPIKSQNESETDDRGLIDSVVGNRLTFTQYDGVTNWTLRQQVLGYLNDKGLQSETGYSNFWNTNLALSEGLPVWIRQEITNRQQAAEALESEINILREEMALLALSNNPIDQTNYVNKFADLTDKLAQYESSFNTFIDQLIAHNNGLSATTVHEANQKQFYDVHLRHIKNGTNQFPAQDINDLRAISAQCPFAGGPSVYLAREVLYLLTGEHFLNECESAGERAQPSIPENRQYQVQIVPNPAGNFFALTNLPKTGPLTLRLTNTFGTILMERQNLSERDIVDVSTQPAGVYYLLLTSDRQIIFSGKIIVSK